MLKKQINGFEYAKLSARDKAMYKLAREVLNDPEHSVFELDYKAKGFNLTRVGESHRDNAAAEAAKKKAEFAVEGNPWRKGEGFNLTKQGEIYKHDPALAEQLKREAQAV